MDNRANVRPYNPHVLIGNWYEDRVMEEVNNDDDLRHFFVSMEFQEVLNDFLDKRSTGQLASQKLTEVERMSKTVSN